MNLSNLLKYAIDFIGGSLKAIPYAIESFIKGDKHNG